jgi:hypothetical protein
VKITGTVYLVIALAILVSGCLCGGGDTTQTTDNLGATDQGPVTTLAEAISGGGAPTTQPATPTTHKATVTTQKPGGLTGAITDLAAAITSGAALKCTYTYQDIVTESWVKGKKFSSTSTVSGMTVNAVSDGVWMYSWNDGEKTGVKFNLEEMKKLSAGNAGAQKSPDMAEISKSATNVQCSPDVITDSKFIPPSDIQFQDMGETLKQLQQLSGQMKGGQGGQGDPCAVCKMIPDAKAKQNCLDNCGG